MPARQVISTSLCWLGPRQTRLSGTNSSPRGNSPSLGCKPPKVLGPIVRHSDIDICVIRGRVWTSSPDDFELQLGNCVAYGLPLFERGDRYHVLRDRWLPFYDDELRRNT